MLALHNQEADGAGNPSLGAQFSVAGEPPAVQPGIFTADKRRSNGKRDGWSALVFVKARSACICVPFSGPGGACRRQIAGAVAHRDPEDFFPLFLQNPV